MSFPAVGPHDVPFSPSYSWKKTNRGFINVACCEANKVTSGDTGPSKPGVQSVISALQASELLRKWCNNSAGDIMGFLDCIKLEHPTPTG
jgi:hypothetical protein